MRIEIIEKVDATGERYIIYQITLPAGVGIRFWVTNNWQVLL